MGSLKDFDLPKLQERFRLKVLVETGTGEGHSLRHALATASWNTIHSIEVDLAMFEAAKEFKQFGVHLWHGRSIDMLPEVIEAISGRGPALFWLDAHFPGNLSGVLIDAEADMSVRLPLESELRAIVANRDVSLDLFIIDDAWIYRDGIAECGDWEQREAVTGGVRDDFIREILGKTHGLVQYTRANGYTIGIPFAASMYLFADELKEGTIDPLRLF